MTGAATGLPRRGELEDLREHLERYRAVTLQVLELVTDEQLDWRPSPDQYSLGQQLVHIAQAEDLHAHGLFEDDWDMQRARLPKRAGTRADVRERLEGVRRFTREHLDRLRDDDLAVVRELPDGSAWSLRSGLWFILEHEIHHKGQIWLYLRQLGITPPFYAVPLAEGERPDIRAREELGGF